VTAPAIRPVLWSGHAWVDRLRPEHRVLTGRAYDIAKRAMDLALVLIAAPLWVPLALLIAAAIKIDDPSGPVMFRQTRSGKGGRPITVHKFRTMVPNAEEMKWELRHLNEVEWPLFKMTNDPRITRPGRLLRKTSLDELPQLWDVLVGALSLVGPRPNDFAPDQYDLWQTERLDVKPGVTGLWQLYGRGVAAFDDSNRLDIAYVQRRSLWFDILILVRTIPAVLTQRGAA
jgi:lipopolysaccharide/colanic/teichoic acid biosynthesis glycosyltransferase